MGTNILNLLDNKNVEIVTGFVQMFAIVYKTNGIFVSGCEVLIFLRQRCIMVLRLQNEYLQTAGNH